ncbi:hypothetical protein C8R44DRAFT_736682 [Mycena epipterygia]|nr:hypothetical protein C8R44DRAFT_736682 [Mycena epipterygia]
MALDAVLAAFVLSAAFLGFTAWSSIIVYEGPKFSSRWISHTSHVFHAIRLGGISPVFLFLSILVPALLCCALVHQDRQSLEAREAEALKYLFAKEAMINAQKICEQQCPPINDLRASFKCGICSGPFTQPYTLAPCGHTFDHRCLQESFRLAPPSPLDTQLPPRKTKFDLHYLQQFLGLAPPTPAGLLLRKKFCPQCRAEISITPTLAWTVKTVADAIADSDPDADEPLEKGDPWKGIFCPRRHLILAALARAGGGAPQ